MRSFRNCSARLSVPPPAAVADASKSLYGRYDGVPDGVDVRSTANTFRTPLASGKRYVNNEPSGLNLTDKGVLVHGGLRHTSSLERRAAIAAGGCDDEARGADCFVGTSPQTHRHIDTLVEGEKRAEEKEAAAYCALQLNNHSPSTST